MIITIREILDMVIMIAFVGFIFKDVFRRPLQVKDPLEYYTKKFTRDNFKFAILVTAPAIILHELGHKFVAISFGLQATFHAAYFWLFLGLLLKMLNFGFIFFVPAFVTYPALSTAFQTSIIAFAGPFVNLVLWLGSNFAIKKKLFKKKYLSALFLTSKINMFLFFFNMLPIPPFDGFHFFSNIIKLF